MIINATPVGMGNTRESPLNENEINARYVFDMIYDPAETRLMKMAKERGAEVIPGIEMFVHQAARQFEIWTGKPAPWDDMLRVVTLALNERTAARQPQRTNCTTNHVGAGVPPAQPGEARHCFCFFAEHRKHRRASLARPDEDIWAYVDCDGLSRYQIHLYSRQSATNPLRTGLPKT